MEGYTEDDGAASSDFGRYRNLIQSPGRRDSGGLVCKYMVAGRIVVFTKGKEEREERGEPSISQQQERQREYRVEQTKCLRGSAAVMTRRS